MNIAIAGYGVEGKSNYEYFRSRGTISIADERSEIPDLPSGVPAILGAGAFQKLSGFDLVVRSAGVAPRKIKTDGKIWSATNEFFAKCKTPIIGVTGTKGKGTTASMITSILRASNHKTVLVGNIGVPALSVLDEANHADVVVYELSSFQLWDLERSPHVAVVLLIEPDHLNVHEGMNDYVLAKANIGAHQTADDVLIYHPDNQQSARIAGISLAGHKLRYLTPEAAHVSGDMIVIDGTEICAVSEVGLLGEYNLQNICAALSAAWQYTQDAAAAGDAIRSFKGLPHRLEFVREHDEVKYYNDSFSSAPTATMAAITAFNEPIVLIVGGFDRGIDFTPLADAIAKRPNIRQIVAIGQTRDRLTDELRACGVQNVSPVDDNKMAAIVAKATEYAQAGDVVLLSPGCASFDMFKNFYERGELFKQAVGEL